MLVLVGRNIQLVGSAITEARISLDCGASPCWYYVGALISRWYQSMIVPLWRVLYVSGWYWPMLLLLCRHRIHWSSWGAITGARISLNWYQDVLVLSAHALVRLCQTKTCQAPEKAVSWAFTNSGHVLPVDFVVSVLEILVLFCLCFDTSLTCLKNMSSSLCV